MLQLTSNCVAINSPLIVLCCDQAKDTVELLTKQARPISEEVKRIAQRLMSQRRASQSAAAAEASSNDDFCLRFLDATTMPCHVS